MKKIEISLYYLGISLTKSSPFFHVIFIKQGNYRKRLQIFQGYIQIITKADLKIFVVLWDNGTSNEEDYFMIFLNILAAVVILVIGFTLARRNSDDLSAMSLISTLSIGFAICVLTFPYFAANTGNLLFAVLETMHYGPSAVAMNVEESIIPFLGLQGPIGMIYMILLYSLYIIGPISASIFIIGFSRSLMEVFRFGRYHDVHVFSELNERSVIIADSLYKQNPKQLRVFCASDSAPDHLKIKARKSHSVLLNKEDNGIHISPRSRYTFYELYDDPIRSLNQTAELIQKLTKDSTDRSNILIRTFISHNELELVRDIDLVLKKNKCPVQVRYIDEANALVTELCHSLISGLPLGEPGHHFHILLLGCGTLGSELLRTLTWLFILPDTKCTIHAADRNARSIATSLKTECPELLNASIDSYFKDAPEEKNYDIIFHSLDAEKDLSQDILSGFPRPDLIISAMHEDDLNHRTAKILYRYYAADDSRLRVPLIAARVRSSELSELMPASDGIHYFGNMAYQYDYSHLIHPDLETGAKACHLAYCASQEWTSDIEQSFYRYVNENSSFAQALASSARRQYILYSKPENMSEAEWIQTVLDDKDLMRRLAEAEHDRWNAYQRANGWQKASIEQAEVFAAASRGKAVKSDQLLLHPAIVPYSELAETERKMDEIRHRFDPELSSVNYIASDYMIIRAMLSTSIKTEQ